MSVLTDLFTNRSFQASEMIVSSKGTQMFDLKFHICDISILVSSFFTNEIVRKQNLLVLQQFGYSSKTFSLKWNNIFCKSNCRAIKCTYQIIICDTKWRNKLQEKSARKWTVESCSKKYTPMYIIFISELLLIFLSEN